LTQKSSKGISLKTILSFAVGLILFAVIMWIGGGLEGLRQLAQVQLFPLVLALLATIGINGSVAFRWGTLANTIAGRKVAGWFEYFHYFVIGGALGFILPKDLPDIGGRALWLNQRHAMPLSQSSASVVLDRLFDLMGSAGFVIAAVPFFLKLTDTPTTLMLMGVLALLMGLALTLAYRPLMNLTAWGMNLGIHLVNLVPGLRKRQPKKLDFVDLDRGVTLKVYVLTVLKFIFTATRLACFSWALNLPITPALFFIGLPVAQLSYVFAFTPGGLGILEAGWLAILTLGGVSTQDGSLFVVGQRILLYVLYALLTLVSQGIYTLRQPDAAKQGA
jgi:uncharacterized membrane protein YbhN (UPF0104 family)